MDHLWNFIKGQAGSLDGAKGVARFGLISSFDAATYTARVLLQPENVLSGWLPVSSFWLGDGWGVAAPLPAGTQVLVVAQEAEAQDGIIVGALWSLKDRPVQAPIGELWLQHQAGSVVKLRNDGSILLHADNVRIEGDLMVTGDVSDKNGAHGTVASFRAAYDQHTHQDPQGGNTSAPSVTL